MKVLIQAVYISTETKVCFERTEKFSNRQRNMCDQRDFYNLAEKRTYYFEMLTKLEPIIQSEVSQKEKHQYSILTHIYGI